MKILFINNIISPYRVPIYNYLAGSANHKVKVFFLAETAKHMFWKINKSDIKFEYDILEGFNFFIPKMQWTLHFNTGVWGKLEKENPDVIVGLGYDYFTNWIALVWSKLKRKKYVLWSGSTLDSSKSKNIVINILKRVFVKSVDSYVTYGTKATDYILKFGAKKENIITSQNTVDIDYWLNEIDKRKNQETISTIRKLHKGINIVYVGRLVEGKGIVFLLDVFREIKERHSGKLINLLVVGDGDRKVEYEKYCIQNNIQDVFFTGFKQQNEIIDYFLASDFFVFPTFNDVWGLVVNEAMACGLPVISSKSAGAAWDLIKDGENGYVYNTTNREELAKYMEKLIFNDEIRKIMGKNNILKIKNLNIKKYATDILSSINI